MPFPVQLTTTILEGTTGYYSFTIVDAFGAGVSAVVIDSLTLTYYDVFTQTVVNGRLNQNILNTNNGTLTTDNGPPLVTTVAFELQPLDTVILDPTHEVEQRVMVFQWTWNTGTRKSAHQVQFGIENMVFVPTP